MKEREKDSGYDGRKGRRGRLPRIFRKRAFLSLSRIHPNTISLNERKRKYRGGGM